MSYNKENHVKNLPDRYNKSAQSNNAKILAMEQDAVNLLRKELQEVYEIGDIFKATGKTLDLYGDMVGQPRGVATDDQYRYMIRLKIAQNISTGNYPSVLEALSVAFNCHPSEICLVDAESACAATLVSIPIATVTAANFTTIQAAALIQRLMPIGVSLESASFEGTFEFSDAEMEYSEEAGFTDAEGGEIGGYFGFIHGNVYETLLPI